jgi:hypothetical protein
MAKSYGGNMLLITSTFRDEPSFKMIPSDLECPYMEVIYDRISGLLIIISKTPVKKATMLPRLSPAGDVIPAKGKMNGKTHQEQRLFADTYQEYYIGVQEEIVAFIEAFAINTEDMKYAELLPLIEPKEKAIMHNMDEGAILDDKGNPISGKKGAKGK